MNKLEFMNELGALADKFAFLLEQYTDNHEGYDGRTEANKPIIIGTIRVSIQNGVLATVGVDIGCSDAEHSILMKKYPNTSKEWSIEDR